MSKARSAILITALAATLGLAADAPAKLRGGARYAGKTSEGFGVALRLSRGGTYVARMRISYRVKCDNGSEGTPSTELFNLKIGRHGRFAYNGTYTGRVDKSKNRVKLQGQVTGRRASGRFSLTAVGTPSGSTQKVRCRSEVVSWHVRRTP